MRPTLLIFAAAFLTLATAGHASELRLSPPLAEPGPHGARISGAVCATAAPVVSPPQAVVLERRGAGGVIERREARLRGGPLLGQRARCAVYTLATDWRLVPGDTISACLPGRCAS